MYADEVSFSPIDQLQDMEHSYEYITVESDLVEPVPLTNMASSCEASSLIITQIQAGLTSGIGNLNSEFVELYNSGTDAVNLTGCSIFMKNASRLSSFEVKLSGTIAQQEFGLIVNNYKSGMVEVGYYDSLLSQNRNLPALTIAYEANNKIIAGGGYVELLGENKTIINQVGFRKLDDLTYSAAPQPIAGNSIKRCSNDKGLFIDSGNNSNDFVLTKEDVTKNIEDQIVHIGLMGPLCSSTVIVPEDEEDEPVVNPDPDEPIDPADPIVRKPTCEGIQITELLPNPAGADAGKEYIELWNATNEIIELNGCGLQVAGSNKTYTFTNADTLQPGEYRVFYDSKTGLTLPNAAGGKVWLIDGNSHELHEVIYPANMADDVAWASFADGWALTFMQTPNAENIFMALKPCDTGLIRNPETNRCVTGSTASAALAQCAIGQERNPETNRCRNVTTSTALLTPCREGQYRNPETNRCRNLETVAGGLVPCNENQERNLETNRCRLISTSSLTSCKEGQERNPETNRCRNVLAVNTGEDIPFAVTPVGMSASSKFGWGVAGIVALGAIGYGAYEWRREIRRFTGRFFTVKTGKK